MAILRTLTQHQINQGALRCPPNIQKIELCLGDCPGLYALVTPTNQTWYFRHKDFSGKTCHAKIGAVSQVPLAEAKKHVTLLRSQVATVGTLKKTVAEDTSKAELTFAKFFENHYYPYVVPRKLSHVRDRQLAVRVIKTMGDKKLSKITRLMLSDFHRGLLEIDGLAPSHCDMHIRFIKHALQLAVDWSMLEKNPASRYPMFNPDNRSNDFLTEAELQRFVQTVKASKNQVIANLILFMLSSGLRLTSALTIKYTDLNMENRTISMAASRNKSRRLKVIPMGDLAAQAILSQSATRGDSEFVWINPKTGDRYKNINKAFDVLRKKAGLPTFKIHGLRRTFATTLANAGTPINVIQQLLTHASPVTTDLYIKVSSSNLLAATQGVSSVLQSAMAGAVSP
jgi:integrase